MPVQAKGTLAESSKGEIGEKLENNSPQNNDLPLMAFFANLYGHLVRLSSRSEMTTIDSQQTCQGESSTYQRAKKSPTG